MPKHPRDYIRQAIIKLDKLTKKYSGTNNVEGLWHCTLTNINPICVSRSRLATIALHIYSI
jgi:hypothetical protein